MLTIVGLFGNSGHIAVVHWLPEPMPSITKDCKFTELQIVVGNGLVKHVSTDARVCNCKPNTSGGNCPVNILFEKST